MVILLIIIQTGNDYLEKNINLEFQVVGGAMYLNEAEIVWQIVNTGEEAMRCNCLRGGFEKSDASGFKRFESTAYKGTHWVQAYVIKDNKCIAKSKEVLVKIR